MIDAATQDGKDQFRSESQQQTDDNFTNEALFTAFITPFFNEVLAEFDMVFVNSENDPSMSHSSVVGTSTNLNLRPIVGFIVRHQNGQVGFDSV